MPYFFHTAMARKVNLVQEINDYKESWKLSIRIINLWYIKKSQKASSVEMIFMDEKVNEYLLLL